MELDANAFQVWVRSWGIAAAVANARHEGYTVDQVEKVVQKLHDRAVADAAAQKDAAAAALAG